MRTSALRIVAVLMLPGLASAATFIRLGSLPGLGYSSASGVSADGATAVGSSGNGGNEEGFRWTGGVMTGLGFLPGDTDSSADKVSADGAVVVGTSSVTGTSSQAFRWAGGVMTGLGLLPDGFNSEAFDVSADGAVVVGMADHYYGDVEAFRWTGGVTTGLGVLPGDNGSSAKGVSADGAVVVGASYKAANSQAFRWTGGVMTGLGVLPGALNSVALDVSADGAVVVGESDDGFASMMTEAFRWTGGVMTGLGFLGPRSIAEGVSADGAVVVGKSGGQAFVWTQSTGMKRLVDVLGAGGATGLSGWTLDDATGISADGQWVSGHGNLGAFLAKFSLSDLNIVPDAFAFPDQTRVALSTLITSAPVTITGISAAAPVSVTGGEYSIGCGVLFTNAPGSINNGDTVCVQQMSSAMNSTATDTMLTIGGVTDTFTTSTRAASGGGGGGALNGFSLLGLVLIGVLRRKGGSLSVRVAHPASTQRVDG